MGEVDRLPTRLLRFLDLMILIVGIAVGIAPMTAYRAANIGYAWGTEHFWLYTFQSYVTPPLASLTLTATCLALIPPRPPFRRLMREPGFVGCITASLCWLLVGPCEVFVNAYNFSKNGIPASVPSTYYFSMWLRTVAYETGFMVAGAWACLGLSGRWRMGGRADWLRMALCLSFIAMVLSHWVWILLS